jgi:hypothetical protein
MLFTHDNITVLIESKLLDRPFLGNRYCARIVLLYDRKQGVYLPVSDYGVAYGATAALAEEAAAVEFVQG